MRWWLPIVSFVAACSPTLDWREVRPEGTALTLLLPCRPQTQAREVELAGRRLRLTLLACSAGGQTWGVAFADVADPTQVVPVLQALRQALAGNIGAGAGSTRATEVRGATPNAASARLAFAGHLPDGSEVQEQVALFAYGTQVFQVSAVGSRLPEEGVDTFFASLRLGS